MSKLIAIALLATFIMSNDGEDKYSSYSYEGLLELRLQYREAQKQQGDACALQRHYPASL